MCDIGALPPTRLSTDRISCARGGWPVFADLSFALGSGEALIVRGPNGAGKSTLLMALAGLITPSAGTISITGASDDAPPHHHIGHRSGVRGGLGVAETLAFWQAVSGGAETPVADALERAGLAGLAGFDAGILSAGQNRRLALARLLVSPRPLWLLDEPTSALDAAGSVWFSSLLDAHLAAGGLAVIATHLPLGVEDRAGVQSLDMGAGQ